MFYLSYSYNYGWPPAGLASLPCTLPNTCAKRLGKLWKNSESFAGRERLFSSHLFETAVLYFSRAFTVQTGSNRMHKKLLVPSDELSEILPYSVAIVVHRITAGAVTDETAH